MGLSHTLLFEMDTRQEAFSVVSSFVSRLAKNLETSSWALPAMITPTLSIKVSIRVGQTWDRIEGSIFSNLISETN
jgi:hypothetical protein